MKQLLELRKARGLSRTELAERSGISRWTIRAHELGQADGVETKTGAAIAAALGVSEQALFFEQDTDLSVNTLKILQPA